MKCYKCHLTCVPLIRVIKNNKWNCVCYYCKKCSMIYTPQGSCDKCSSSKIILYHFKKDEGDFIRGSRFYTRFRDRKGNKLDCLHG